MCGIVGCLHKNFSNNDWEDVLGRMSKLLHHRGPDSEGLWFDAKMGVGLGHRRLSIIDRSMQGHQPMRTDDGRYTVVFNGEIYNFLELRQELELQGYCFKGNSDTEVVLAAVNKWGVPHAIQRFVGMFAFALWDHERRTLTLVRDRLGEKPLYYGWVKGALVFGSELKAIRAFPGFDAAIDRQALALFMRHSYVPAPWSIYQGIWKLAPGTFVQFRANAAAGERGESCTYWSARSTAEAQLREPFLGSEHEATDELERILRRSIAGQMIADVPLGAFLSGGIDSSTVVALMQAQSSLPVKTFTIGFHEGGYNEAQHAKAVALHLGVEHTELYVTPEEALAVIPKLPTLYDEPFADSSQIPTFLVSELARRHVTVSLSGDGGDELFGGYNRYVGAMALWRKVGHMPMQIRAALARLITVIPPATWSRFFSVLRALDHKRLRYANPEDKMRKIAEVLSASQQEAMYLRLVSQWHDPAAVVLGAEEPKTMITDPKAWLNCPDFEQCMMYLDAVTYLPDDILVKVDRAAMGVSLETRVPLLDHRIVEFAWRLPLAMKIRNGEGKWILRQVLYKYVPKELMERPKMGFGVPIEHWLRGPLRDWAEALLDEGRLDREGFFNSKAIRQKWIEHLAGHRNWQHHLWNVLMFQAWLDAGGA